ncbi:MAG: hypothetical protein ASARMPREDX12_001622 [Alectoria sarmentosa]|nr:MAG: hypothetical protein ASARMPREDX12_001622 [Alectoria sarmentosa]
MSSKTPERFLGSLFLDDRKILVAVDFGTTFSGVAWPDDHCPIEWFKLDLDPSQKPSQSEIASQYPVQDDNPPLYDYDAEQSVIDYLTALREHTERYLKDKLSSAALWSMAIDYIITTPAVWSDAAQAKTRACAEAAGMGKSESLNIVSEPEAAAIYAFRVTHPNDLKIGDTFVLCDAGGGTVDLISYTVTSLEPILGVDEAAPGTGKLCGGMFLNRIFEKHLVETCGSNTGWDTQAMDRFEVVKKQFSGNASKDFSIPVPGLVDNVQQGVRRGKWNLTGDRMSNIFNPVIRETIGLVKDQIRATRREITAVLLVGGFGQSGYLRESLRKELGSNIKVLVPQNGWQAVVRGDLMKALAQSIPSSATLKVGSRAARKHYGFESYTQFVDGIHSRSKGEWREYEGEFKTMAMHWFIKKGNPVKEDEPTEFPLYTTRRVKKGRPQDHTVVILCCTDPKDKGAPVYRDDGVDYLVRLTANFGSISESTLDRRMGRDGQEWYFIAFTIRLTTLSASTRYALCYKGKEYGSVTAEQPRSEGLNFQRKAGRHRDGYRAILRQKEKNAASQELMIHP